jgi:ribosomal protein S4
LFNFVLFKSFFRIDILLWKLNFCRSTFEARQLINSKIIIVNGITSYLHNKYLIKGDILFIKDKTFLSKYTLKYNSLTYIKRNDLFSFFEIDYYTGTVVIIKDVNSFSFEDYKLSFFNYIDSNKYNYIT